MTTPCSTCTTLADCSRCAAFDRWLEATAPPEPPERRCWRCVDAEWLLLCGEAWDTVAARLRMKPPSLAVHLRRHGRDDLLPRVAR